MKYLGGFVTAPLLQVEQLECERDDRVLIKNLSFELYNGEILQVEGANGSGKTTLLRVLCGLSDEFQGELTWCGRPRRRVEADFRRQTLYCGHLTGIKMALSPRENLRWILQVKGVSAADAPAQPSLDQALHDVGLGGFEDVPVYTLSAGQKRRVALARLLVEPARLWVLDEPFTAIDRHGVAELEGLIQGHAAKGGSVLITSHHALELNGLRSLQLGLGRGAWQIN